MKYLIAGLGNIGPAYQHTRHNIGFQVLDALAKSHGCTFTNDEFAYMTRAHWGVHELLLLKPTTYMNQSGRALSCWMRKKHIPLGQVLVIADDLNLAFGKVRLRSQGSAGGHNGLKSITQELGTDQYARLRFGIGNDFLPGQQADYVLSDFSEVTQQALPGCIDHVIKIIHAFCQEGIAKTMNSYN